LLHEQLDRIGGRVKLVSEEGAPDAEMVDVDVSAFTKYVSKLK
jgi:hypothetical protein